MKLHNTLILFLIWGLIILLFFNDNIFFLKIPFGCTFRPAWSFLMVSYSFHNLDFLFILSIKPSILYLITPIWNPRRSYSTILLLLLLMCFCWLLFIVTYVFWPWLFHLGPLYFWEYWRGVRGSWMEVVFFHTVYVFSLCQIFHSITNKDYF